MTRAEETYRQGKFDKRGISNGSNAIWAGNTYGLRENQGQLNGMHAYM